MSGERQPSEEVDERQLELASEAGDAYREAAEYMIEEVAETGDLTTEDDYLVGVAQEGAEVVRYGEDTGIVEVDLFDEDDRKLATTRGVYKTNMVEDDNPFVG